MSDWLLAPALKWTVALLALYGAGQAAWQLAGLARRWWRGRTADVNVSILLLVRNKGDKIEGLLRTIARVARSPRPGLLPPDLVVVDHHSSDDTPRIVERLVPEIPGLQLVRLGDLARGGRPACEVGLFACHSRIVLVLDLLGPVAAPLAARAVEQMLGMGD